MDNSISTAHSIILDALRGAGEMGLTLDTLASIIGAVNQEKLVIKRLYDLQNRGKVLSLPNNAWKIKLASDGSTTKPPIITPEKPLLNLPGNPKFSSYKNALQEYCQKRKAPVPKYNSTKSSTGFIGNVSFLDFNFTAEAATDTPKDADLRAAFAALKGLGYFNTDLVYTAATFTNTGKKRSSVSGEPDNSAATKKMCFEKNSKSFKSRLNELAQQNKLQQPTYETISTTNGFFTTVTFNGRQFKSASCMSKKKDSEQNASEVALTFLTSGQQANGEQNGKTADDVADMIKSARVGSNVMNLSLKNRLQEYCQRLKKELPTYKSEMGDNGFFMTVCTVDEIAYEGGPAKTRKEAEKNAAEAALKELGLMAVREQ
ncbi:uncharacterized protein [Clytia hemisphaerica]|uniref:DRBM domain-containing protein n=1 Tax=Clytia hemisphaerica TaxID=252671 RepID=A0A7M5WMY2_9CNID